MGMIKKSTKENIEYNEKVQKIVNNALEKMCNDAMTHTQQKNKIASNHDCSFPSDDVLDTENITIVSGERREEVNIVDTHNGVCGLYFSSNAQVEDIWIAYLTKHPHMWVGRLGSESIKDFSKIYELDRSIFNFHPLEQNLYITQCECCHEFCEVKYVKNK